MKDEWKGQDFLLLFSEIQGNYTWNKKKIMTIWYGSGRRLNLHKQNFFWAWYLKTSLIWHLLICLHPTRLWKSGIVCSYHFRLSNCSTFFLRECVSICTKKNSYNFNFFVKIFKLFFLNSRESSNSVVAGPRRVNAHLTLLSNLAVSLSLKHPYQKNLDYPHHQTTLSNEHNLLKKKNTFRSHTTYNYSKKCFSFFTMNFFFSPKLSPTITQCDTRCGHKMSSACGLEF